jgi:hypothetical protein
MNNFLERCSLPKLSSVEIESANKSTATGITEKAMEKQPQRKQRGSMGSQRSATALEKATQDTEDVPQHKKGRKSSDDCTYLKKRTLQTKITHEYCWKKSKYYQTGVPQQENNTVASVA